MSLCGRNAVQIIPEARCADLDLTELAERLRQHGDFAMESGLLKGILRDSPGPGSGSIELTVFPDGRAIVGGGTQPDFARGIYARYVGH